LKKIKYFGVGGRGAVCWKGLVCVFKFG